MRNRAYYIVAVSFLVAFVATFNYGGCGGGGGGGSSGDTSVITIKSITPSPGTTLNEYTQYNFTATISYNISNEKWGLGTDRKLEIATYNFSSGNGTPASINAWSITNPSGEITVNFSARPSSAGPEYNIPPNPANLPNLAFVIFVNFLVNDYCRASNRTIGDVRYRINYQ